MAKRKKFVKSRKVPTPSKRRIARKPRVDPAIFDNDDEEIVDDGPDPDDPDEGKCRDELRMGDPEGQDPLFRDDDIEKKGSSQRYRIDGN